MGVGAGEGKITHGLPVMSTTCRFGVHVVEAAGLWIEPPSCGNILRCAGIGRRVGVVLCSYSTKSTAEDVRKPWDVQVCECVEGESPYNHPPF